MSPSAAANYTSSSSSGFTHFDSSFLNSLDTDLDVSDDGGRGRRRSNYSHTPASAASTPSLVHLTRMTESPMSHSVQQQQHSLNDLTVSSGDDLSHNTSSSFTSSFDNSITSLTNDPSLMPRSVREQWQKGRDREQVAVELANSPEGIAAKKREEYFKEHVEKGKRGGGRKSSATSTSSTGPTISSSSLIPLTPDQLQSKLLSISALERRIISLREAHKQKKEAVRNSLDVLQETYERFRTQKDDVLQQSESVIRHIEKVQHELHKTAVEEDQVRRMRMKNEGGVGVVAAPAVAGSGSVQSLSHTSHKDILPGTMGRTPQSTIHSLYTPDMPLPLVVKQQVSVRRGKYDNPGVVSPATVKVNGYELTPTAVSQSVMNQDENDHSAASVAALSAYPLPPPLHLTEKLAALASTTLQTGSRIDTHIYSLLLDANECDQRRQELKQRRELERRGEYGVSIHAEKEVHQQWVNQHVFGASDDATFSAATTEPVQESKSNELPAPSSHPPLHPKLPHAHSFPAPISASSLAPGAPSTIASSTTSQQPTSTLLNLQDEKQRYLSYLSLIKPHLKQEMDRAKVTAIKKLEHDMDEKRKDTKKKEMEFQQEKILMKELFIRRATLLLLQQQDLESTRARMEYRRRVENVIRELRNDKSGMWMCDGGKQLMEVVKRLEREPPGLTTTETNMREHDPTTDITSPYFDVDSYVKTHPLPSFSSFGEKITDPQVLYQQLYAGSDDTTADDAKTSSAGGMYGWKDNLFEEKEFYDGRDTSSDEDDEDDDDRKGGNRAGAGVKAQVPPPRRHDDADIDDIEDPDAQYDDAATSPSLQISPSHLQQQQQQQEDIKSSELHRRITRRRAQAASIDARTAAAEQERIQKKKEERVEQRRRDEELDRECEDAQREKREKIRHQTEQLSLQHDDVEDAENEQKRYDNIRPATSPSSRDQQISSTLQSQPPQQQQPRPLTSQPSQRAPSLNPTHLTRSKSIINNLTPVPNAIRGGGRERKDTLSTTVMKRDSTSTSKSGGLEPYNDENNNNRNSISTTYTDNADIDDMKQREESGGRYDEGDDTVDDFRPTSSGGGMRGMRSPAVNRTSSISATVLSPPQHRLHVNRPSSSSSSSISSFTSSASPQPDPLPSPSSVSRAGPSVPSLPLHGLPMLSAYTPSAASSRSAYAPADRSAFDYEHTPRDEYGMPVDHDYYDENQQHQQQQQQQQRDLSLDDMVDPHQQEDDEMLRYSATPGTITRKLSQPHHQPHHPHGSDVVASSAAAASAVRASTPSQTSSTAVALSPTVTRAARLTSISRPSSAAAAAASPSIALSPPQASLSPKGLPSQTRPDSTNPGGMIPMNARSSSSIVPGAATHVSMSQRYHSHLQQQQQQHPHDLSPEEYHDLFGSLDSSLSPSSSDRSLGEKILEAELAAEVRARQEQEQLSPTSSSGSGGESAIMEPGGAVVGPASGGDVIALSHMRRSSATASVGTISNRSSLDWDASNEEGDFEAFHVADPDDGFYDHRPSPTPSKSRR